MKAFPLLLSAFTMLVACQPAAIRPEELPLPEQVTLGLSDPQGKEMTLHVEIADTADERARGLMFREDLEPDGGMLFVFDAEQELSFWMKHTLIPLDIVFFDGEGEAVSTHTMLPCEADPCMTYASLKPAKFALEIQAGSVKEHGIAPGWKLSSVDGVKR